MCPTLAAKSLQNASSQNVRKYREQAQRIHCGSLGSNGEQHPPAASLNHEERHPLVWIVLPSPRLTPTSLAQFCQESTKTAEELKALGRTPSSATTAKERAAEDRFQVWPGAHIKNTSAAEKGGGARTGKWIAPGYDRAAKSQPTSVRTNKPKWVDVKEVNSDCKATRERAAKTKKARMDFIQG